MAAMDVMRKAFNGLKAEEAVENILNMFAHTKNNREFCDQMRKTRLF
jgi:transcription termination factor Rho